MGYFTFASYLSARVLMALASSMLSVAIGYHLYLYSNDPFDLALVGLMQITPMLLLFILTGWVVDHFPRKLILTICGMVEACVYIGLALSMNAGDLDRVQIFSLLFVHGIARAFYSPASQAVLPNIVSTAFLPRAVSVTSAGFTTAQTLGPLGGGLLLAWLNYHTYWVLVGLAASGGCLYLLLPKIAVNRPSERGLKLLLGGIRFVFRDPIVLPSISLDLAIVLSGSVLALLPVFAIDVLHVGSEELGLMRAMPAMGGVVMGLIMAKLPPLGKSGKRLFIALAVFSCAILLFALSSTLWLSLVALWVYGAADMISVNLRSTLIQLATPDDLRGRVSAVNMLFIGTSNELGDFRAGAVAALIGPVATVLTGAAMAFTVTIGGYLLFPKLRALDKLADAEYRPDNRHAGTATS